MPRLTTAERSRCANGSRVPFGEFHPSLQALFERHNDEYIQFSHHGTWYHRPPGATCTAFRPDTVYRIDPNAPAVDGPVPHIHAH